MAGSRSPAGEKDEPLEAITDSLSEDRGVWRVCGRVWAVASCNSPSHGAFLEVSKSHPQFGPIGQGRKFPTSPQRMNPFILCVHSLSSTDQQTNRPTPSSPANPLLVGLTYLAGLTQLPALPIGSLLQLFLSAPAAGWPHLVYSVILQPHSHHAFLSFLGCSLLQHRGRPLLVPAR